MTCMTIAFIADLHLNPQRPASFRMFEEFLAESTQLERLYILGDLFEFWVGDDGSDSLNHVAVEKALRNTVQVGVKVFFMHGNRDFLVGEEFAHRTGCKLLADPKLLTLDGRKLLLTHGDALCTDDVEHQHARQQMLSSKWKKAFLQQPLNERIDAAIALRRTSESTKRTKPMALMDVNQNAVEAMMRQYGVHTMIHGHTHQPAVHEFELAQKPAWRYVLGDWHEQPSALYYQQGKLVLKPNPPQRK